MGADNGAVLIWDVTEGKPWLRWKKANYDTVNHLQFSPDGQRLACALSWVKEKIELVRVRLTSLRNYAL